MNIQTNIATILFIIIPSLVGFSQEKPTSSWNLKDCIDYARKNNIQVQSAKVTQQSANVDLLQAKAQLFPSLTFSSSQGWGHQKTEQTDGKFKSQNAYTGSYTLNGGLTIYNGGKLTRSIRQQQITNTAQEYQVNMAENDIEIAVTEAMIMDTYISQMYNQAGEKVIVFEEAWQAISNAEMSENIKYLAKTGRKYNSELIIVTQELNDIIANEIVGQALINNCDTKILLDQSKFSENFDFIKKFLGLNHFQICQVLSLNKGKDPRNKSKDYFICYANGMSDVYEVGVSQAEALLYASDKPIKDGIKKVAHHFNINYCDAIKYIIENMMKDIEQYQHKHPCDFDNAVNIILDNYEKGSHIFNHAG